MMIIKIRDIIKKIRKKTPPSSYFHKDKTKDTKASRRKAKKDLKNYDFK